MTKQWLTRRAVRSPVSRFTTAPISSSVWRLPFIRASALPSRTRATAFSAESWLCSASTIASPAMSMPCCAATSSIRLRGPTRIGAIRPIFAASTAPRSELSSQGCATAVGVGGSVLQTSISFWYFSWLLTGMSFAFMASSAIGCGRARRAGAPFAVDLMRARDAAAPCGRHVETLASCASIARWSAEGCTLDSRGSVSSRSTTVSSRSRSAGSASSAGSVASACSGA